MYIRISKDARNSLPKDILTNDFFNESEHARKIRFTNLTSHCTIKIFTLSGELISTLDHTNELSGNAFWDMRTINNQEIAPGLYIYHIVENEARNIEPNIGKFAVVR